MDLVFTDFKNVYEESKSEEVIKMKGLPIGITNFDEVSENMAGICYHNIYYKTSILKDNNIHLTENSFYVDNEFVCYPIPFIQTIAYFDIVVYCYRLGRVGQSVSLESKQKNELQHLKVCRNLLDYYFKNSDIMTKEKKQYMAKFISTVVEFQLGIQFSFGISHDRLKKIIEFDNFVKKVPTIYECTTSKTYRAWRLSRKLLYVPIHYYINKKNAI